ncbi:glycosyltransferase family 2 protein [Enterococcus devriesei]|uniref:glycosyltransferase family 2 protein n=1 Tax=Enterococcus devriesei TaxID=319970 RepID=UPI0028AEC2B1|nr:glycosyltransferase [Enterococcus devriesei]
MKVALAIPTYNAGGNFEKVLKLIEKQSENIDYKYICDSDSTDGTVNIARKYGYVVESIPKCDFSHSGTRTKIAQKMNGLGYEYIIFMSQDVYLQPKALNNIIKFAEAKDASVVRGKQEVDLAKGNYFEYYARKKNYGEKSTIFTKEDIPSKGIDTIFTSDAFSIYNLQYLELVNYFGDKVKVSEDMYVAHKLIQAGYSVGYCSEAKVFHTHNYKVYEEFRRYATIGKFYKENDKWISFYGNTNKKGISLATSELKFLFSKKKYHLLLKSVARNISKFIGFQYGKRRA